MAILSAINNGYTDLYKKLRAQYRSVSLRRWCVKHSSGGGITLKQKKEIKAFYKPYRNVSTIFHAYYTEKTGNYSVNYLPNDLYINYIDPS